MTLQPGHYRVQYMHGPVNHVDIPLALVAEIPNVHRYIFPMITRVKDSPALRVEMAMQIIDQLRPRWHKQFPHDTREDELVKYVSALTDRAWREKAMTLSWDARGTSSLRGQNFGYGGHAGNYFVVLEGR